MAYIIHRHGVIYFQQYGWDERLEVVVARITADSLDKTTTPIQSATGLQSVVRHVLVA